MFMLRNTHKCLQRCCVLSKHIKCSSSRTVFSLSKAISGHQQTSSLTKPPQRLYSTQTDGDKDLLRFLKEEIQYEQENVSEIPKFKDFKVEMNDTKVKLTRQFKSERVDISFDVNENVNVDQEEIQVEDDEEQIPAHDIVSYPTFVVQIKKPSGKILHFNCACNTDQADDDDDDDVDSQEDKQYELFRFDSVKICSDSDSETYEAETETMDGELYSMLMNTLLERGVDGMFVHDLLTFSTSVEHRHYVTFLQSLQNLMKEV